MRRILLLPGFALVLFAFNISAQSRQITGRVVAFRDNSPIIGATVLVMGTTIGTTTDVDGNFIIILPEDTTKTGSKPKLIFNFIGMETVVSEVGEGPMSINMMENINQLSEVIAVGYGTQEKQDVTGSISTIKAKDINFVPVTSYEQALQGRSPGVQISGASGELGSEQRIRIRGASSLSANNQPLIVIDGFIVTSTDQTNFVDNNPSNPMADLNPNDIESVEVLKDAAAAAIYGARGSNGVLLITTKRGAGGGKAEKTKFNANISSGVSEATHIRPFLNRSQYIQMFTDASNNAGYPSPDSAWADYGGGSKNGAGTFTDLVNRGKDDNWNSAAYRIGKMSQFDFSANGGSERTKFYVSFGYLTQSGIIIKNDLDRLSGRINVDHQVNGKVKIGLSTNQVITNKQNTPESNSFASPQQANAIAPLIGIRDGLGNYNDSTYYANPYRAAYNSYDKSQTIRNLSNIYGAWEIVKGLSFRSEIGADLYFMSQRGWNGSQMPIAAATPSSGKYGTSNVINYTTNNTLTYSKTFAEKHNLVALLGTSYQEFNGVYSFINAQGLPSDNFQWLASAPQNTAFSSSSTSYTYLSYYARLNYKFDNKYLLSVSVRTDGTSRFIKKNRYGWFPAVSAGWIISEEGFFKNSGLSNTLSFLKIKVSVGLTGNSEINNYAYNKLYTPTFNGKSSGIMPIQLYNENLTWERTWQYDVGIEYGLFNNRISGGVDFYIKNTTDLLFNLPIPATSGYSTTLRNLGKMTNKGVDIYINTKNLVGEFKWSTAFNISTYKNEITDMSGQQVLPANRSLNAAIVGQPIGVFYGVKYAGVDPANGDPLYYMADGTTTNDETAASKQILGNPNPKNYGGISNTFEYKGFELSIFGQWSYGNDIYLASGIFQANNLSYGLDNQIAESINYWKKPGDIINIPRADLSGSSASGVDNSRWVYDGSYFRFKNITLSYSIPKRLVEKIKFTSIKVYGSFQNLFTITRYPGNDPESNYYTPGSLTQTGNLASGIDYYSTPQSKNIVFGINLGF